jgi:predicted O-methyltransferase YrrM
VRPAFRWLWTSSEHANFTYDLTPRNKRYLAQILSLAVNKPADEIASYLAEIEDDGKLRSAIVARASEIARTSPIDPTAHYGRRVGWYAVVRAIKPRIVVETGVDKGLGAAVLCAALLRNQADGPAGHYYGTDVDPRAGHLLVEPYRSVGTILYGDSIESLTRLEGPVDLFINDSDHSADYERREYLTIAPKLSEDAVVIGDNAHVTEELLHFSRAAGRHFLFFQEEPLDHWYFGAGIGLSFKRRNASPR